MSPARDEACLPFPPPPLPSLPDSYMTFPGKSFVGAKVADLSFRSLQTAKQQCSVLGEGCDVVVSTAAGHHLMVGRRFVTPEGPGAVATVHVKTRCSPGYSGQDCQLMCPQCHPSLSCNPLTGLCDGFLYYREAPALVASLKCLPLEVWIFEQGSCWSRERYRSQAEAKAVCQRYLGSTVRKVPPLSKVPDGLSVDGRGGFQQPGVSLWACQRGEDVKLPSFREKLLVSLQEAAPEQRHASWQEAEDACYLQKERCTGLLSLKGAHYTVAGTVLVDSPGSGALLSLKAACSPGFWGKLCQRHSSPCLSTHTHNPLTGRCDGRLRCVHRFSPSCLHGLVHSRCPRGPGWWFWGGHCYYLEEQGSKSWQEAKAACQAYGENVTLLVLSSTKEKARPLGCLFNRRGGKRAMGRQGKTPLVPSGAEHPHSKWPPPPYTVVVNAPRDFSPSKQGRHQGKPGRLLLTRGQLAALTLRSQAQACFSSPWRTAPGAGRLSCRPSRGGPEGRA
ncbi:uncharacterized protein LOC116518904 isoform X1 [Thamnophis elegans]|uniref:uncharacterized protein LOC116518904 isoform X1 n=1 Tax=Thamnophis elegans TaxID=35005 RepID=UPI001378CAB8|nr:uncharacterized protein LOC116518904 isoform X1 [Thamnophis elegans]